MNDDDRKMLNLWIEETRSNFSRALEDRNTDRLLLEDIYTALNREINSLKAEVHLLSEAVKKTTKTVSKENAEVRTAVENTTEEIRQELSTKQKIVIRQIEHFNFLRWFKIWFWDKPRLLFK